MSERPVHIPGTTSRRCRLHADRLLYTPASGTTFDANICDGSNGDRSILSIRAPKPPDPGLWAAGGGA